MEALTRLVAESLARHGFDRPLDYRRLHWSRWFRCDSHHSLLLVPSKPGVFAMAEEIVEVDADDADLEPSLGSPGDQRPINVEERRFSAVTCVPQTSAALAAPALAAPRGIAAKRRMLAVTQFFEDDDMAFTLDRMLAHNPMQPLLASGRYFVRFVIVEDPSQRRSVYNALNQWMANSSEKANGIGSHFAGSLELTPATEYVPASAQGTLFETSSVRQSTWSANAAADKPSADRGQGRKATPASIATPQLDSGAAANLHCPSPFPSGF